MAPPLVRLAGCVDFRFYPLDQHRCLMGFKEWMTAITGRRPRASGVGAPEGPPPVAAAPTESDIMVALDRVEDMVGCRRAGSVQVRRVAQTVRDTMPRRVTSAAALRRTGDATATDYLPEAIGAYTDCRASGPTRDPSKTETSLMLLIDQLDLLSATMDKIFDAWSESMPMH